MQSVAEALIDQLVSREHAALEVARQKEQRDHDASHHIAEDNLQEAHIASVSNAWHADDR